MPAQTLAQKIIARAAGVPQVAVGDIVTCKVDLAMFHDSSGPRRLKPMLAELGATIWDKSKVVLVLDHYLPERDEESRQIIRIARDWARDERLPHVYDGQGICHVVTPQRGHIRPGMLCVGGDSHSPTGGAFGAYMFGVGSTEMLGVVVTGEIWLKVPDTLRFCWSGTLQPGVTAKDMMLRLIGQFGTNGGQYQAVEFSGDAVRVLNMQERMTLCNMTAELGAQTGLVAPDEVTDAALREAGVAPENYAHLHTDEGAALQHFDFDAATLTPYVAAPHSPANAHPVGVFKGQAIQVAYVGACTGAKLTDLEAAASVLKNRRVAAGVTLLVAPASRQDQRAAEESGALHALMAAGATLLPTACGACAGYGGSVGEGNTVISTTARNFKGRMGAATAEVFLASPYTVAASAVAGQIVDPREVMA